MNKGDLVYYYDLEDCEIKSGEIKEVESKQIWIKIDERRSIRFEKEEISFSEEEAIIKFNVWKDKFKNQLLDNNTWIKELFSTWSCDIEGNMTPRAMLHIMKSIIKEKTGIKID